MDTASHSNAATITHPKKKAPNRAPADCVALAQETRVALPTAETAAHFNRQPQTLRWWASRRIGPLQPLRINGRLAWPVAEIKRLLGVA